MALKAPYFASNSKDDKLYIFGKKIEIRRVFEKITIAPGESGQSIKPITMENYTIPSEKDFTLSKVKLLPKGGAQVSYQVTQSVDGEVSITDRTEVCSREVHPDLKSRFEELRPIVGQVFGMTSFLTILDQMGAAQSKKNIAQDYINGLYEKIDVRGIALSGDGDNTGIVITAVLEVGNGLKTCINTPRLKLASESFGFEEELERIAEAIKSEVYAYLFKGKQAQLSLFGELPEGGRPE